MSKAAIALARDKRRTGWPLLRYGFRPFFLGAGLWALVTMAARLADVAGLISGGVAFGDATRWHAHEMLFGYASAVVAGFALTAVPNWTGRLPISGTPLAALCVLWLAGRLALLTTLLPQGFAATIDSAFLPVLAAVLGREIIAGRNFRNIPVCGLILLLGTANAIFHLEALEFVSPDGYGTRGGLGLFALLIGLIGGRIVPSFTNNWLGRQGLPRSASSNPWLERAVHAASAVAVAAWVASPYAISTGIACVAAGMLHAFRLSRWRVWRAWREPLVAILHVGYSWLALGFLFLGFASIVEPSMSSAGLHALGVGAVGTMTLAVMTRATLGHTGRQLHPDRGTVLLYIVISASALTRVAAVFAPSATVSLLIGAAALWIIAFSLFVGIYGPMHLTRRVGDVQ